MRRHTQYVLHTIICMSVLVQLFSVSLRAGINFGSTQSAIKISQGGEFHLSHNLSGVDGTIFVEDTGAITADADKKITFDDGILNNNNTEVMLNATYDPEGSGKVIELSGNSFLRSEPGTIVDILTVAGTNNKIFGQPIFSEPIVLSNAATSLTFAMQSKLTQNIELNGGTVELESDLTLGDGVTLVGSGRVFIDNKRFSFGGKELSFSSHIFWDQANDVVLNSKVNLSSIWAFDGESTLNGNGNVLDLSTGGTLFVGAGSTLNLTDITVKGLGNGAILLADDDAQVIMSSVDIELAQSYTTTIGGIYVCGPSTFILSDKDWWFDVSGSLSVDGVVLWTDRRTTSSIERGFVSFGDPKANFYSSINSGTIKEKVYLSDLESIEIIVNQNTGDIALLEDRMDIAEDNIISNSYAIVNLYNIYEPPPLLGTIISDTSFFQSYHLSPDESITIAGDVTVNGNGSMIVFSNPDEPQFIVNECKTVRLENINFQNINDNTFQLNNGGKIVIGENVIFGLTEDVLFSGGQFEVMGDTFTIYGVGGRRRLGFYYGACRICTYNRSEQRRDFDTRKAFNLLSNTLALKNIELMSIEDIGSNPMGTIKLCGSSTVNFDQDSNHQFLIEGLENIFRMRKNNLKLSGSLTFGNKEHNVLNIEHKVPEGLTEQPIVTFENSFLMLSSTQGIAEINFDDDIIRIINTGFNSFVIGNNAVMGGSQVEIWDHPIRIISDNYEFKDGLVLTSNLTDPIEEADALYVPPSAPEQDDKFIVGDQGHVIDLSGQPRHLIFRSIGEVPEETIYEQDMISLEEAHGNILLKHSVAKDLSVDTNEPLNLTLDHGSIVELAQDSVVLKEDDTLVVSGKSNVIHVTKELIIKGGLILEPHAQLTFCLDDEADEPTLLLEPLITSGSFDQIKFQGKGKVKWRR